MDETTLLILILALLIFCGHSSCGCTEPEAYPANNCGCGGCGCGCN